MRAMRVPGFAKPKTWFVVRDRLISSCTSSGARITTDFNSCLTGSGVLARQRGPTRSSNGCAKGSRFRRAADGASYEADESMTMKFDILSLGDHLPDPALR